jgi:hypothetical protein
MGELKRASLWRKVLDNTLSADESARVSELAKACLRTP